MLTGAKPQADDVVCNQSGPPQLLPKQKSRKQGGHPTWGRMRGSCDSERRSISLTQAELGW